MLACPDGRDARCCLAGTARCRSFVSRRTSCSSAPILRGSARSSPARTLTHESARPLRDDISTDEITPLPVMVHFDATLGRYPYTGFKAGGELPIGRDAIRNAGIEVVVAGRRYGKGSSREHSVVAERAAGVRLVIAESFERIYRQNADNVGLLTSTDFALVERIQRGEPIDLEALVAGRDALAAGILRAGGLLAYGRTLGVRDAPAPTDGTDEPRTLFAKIVDRRTAGHPRHAGAPFPRRRRLRARGLPLHPRVLHGHVRAPARRRLRSRPRAPRSGDHRDVRGPPVLRAPQPGARRAGAGGQRDRAVARASRLRTPLRPYRARLPAAASRRRRPGEHRLAGDLARADGGALRAAGAARRRHRLAHAAQRRGRLRGLRRRHHRHGQRVRHRRGARDHARGAESRVRRTCAARRDGEGSRAASAGRARDPRRRGRGQGLRVRWRCRARARPPTSARP